MNKDGTLENQESSGKQYAAKCRNLRNRYESFLADIKSHRYNIYEEICCERNVLRELENELFSEEVAPHTTAEAVKLADKQLKSESCPNFRGRDCSDCS